MTREIKLFESQDQTRDILKEVMNERLHQEAKWGQQNHDGPFYLAILVEEVGEIAHTILEARAGSGDSSEIRKEIIQVAAVAVAMAEAYDRKAVR